MRGEALHRATLALWVATTILMCVAIYLVFLYVPDERVMGAVQRVFYFHVPVALMAFLAVFVVLVGSAGYLWTREPRWDHLARAATETGVLFCTLVLLTGPIWARPAWGVWWTWEAKLTTTLLLWLLLVSCLMVRGYTHDRDLGARLAAIVGIVAAVDVPIIYKAVDLWKGQHPVLERGGLAPAMSVTFRFCLLVFLLFFCLLLLLRYRVAELEERTDLAVERAGAR